MADSFLKEILGNAGAAALEKAVDRAPILKAVIVPRAVLAWLSTMGKLGYDGELPGTPNSYFSLIKTANETYAGALTIQDQLYTFDAADILHVAASVGVALGIEIDPISEQLKKKDLTQLGNSIDLLVKSEIIKKIKKQRLDKTDDAMAGGPGAPAHSGEPHEASEPELPTKQPGVSKNKTPILPDNIAEGQGHKLKVTKAEASKECEECGQVQFEKDKFSGCMCLKELSKSIKTEKLTDGYMLKFKKDLDADAISTIVDVFKE